MIGDERIHFVEAWWKTDEVEADSMQPCDVVGFW